MRPFTTKLLCLILCTAFIVSCDEGNFGRSEGDGSYDGSSIGSLNGLFSVSQFDKVYFSKGNLQYTTTGIHENALGGTSIGTWRFADNQYAIVGDSNYKISAVNTDWIDLFNWGTSGWKSGAKHFQPWSTSIIANSDYYVGGSPANNLTGSCKNGDWGIFNAISNGGNHPGIWRTMTQSEWAYLLEGRTNAENLIGQATVCETKGLVLLPDTWTLPQGATFTAGFASGFLTNQYDSTSWAAMEEAGAVFLPAGGQRHGQDITDVGEYGGYWTATHAADAYAYVVVFRAGAAHLFEEGWRTYAHHVRLVRTY